MATETGSSLLEDTIRQPSAADAPSTGTTSRPLNVALIGCGAIAQQLHLPILAGHEGIKLAALVDRDVARAQQLAKGYGVEKVFADAAELKAEEIDAAVIATPPFHHAPCTLDLLRRGLHVLVEKPMATTYADAAAMVRTAEESGRVLSVGLFRRLKPSVRMLKALVESHWLGRPIGFEVVWGGFYKWEAATLGNMRKDLAGGGVLMDVGPHVLDLLYYWFEQPGEVLEYRDNALGGIESDCLLRLRLHHRGEAVEGSIELSRARKLGSSFRILCERGDLEYRVSERHNIWVTPRDLQLTDPSRGKPRPYCLQASWADDLRGDWLQTVRAEIDDWLQAIRTGSEPELSGRSALPTVQLIEECYRRVQPMEEPWVQASRVALAPREHTNNGKPRRVLLTGSTGFIGCRVAEVLALRDGWQVRAVVHNPSNAARLARLPVEMVQADLGALQDAERLMEGCDAVVHCAVGTSAGERRKVFAITVDGTRKLARAALAKGVRRFVHLSTITVHDPEAVEIIDESTEVRPPKGSDYGQSKAEAERAVQEAVRDGLPAVILRPVRVYGPFSGTFITRPMEALGRGRFRLVGAADGPSNTVYVDNLVEAIVRSLEAPEEKVKGEVFTIGEPDAMSCREFYEYFAHAFGREIPTVEAAKRESESGQRALALLTWPLSWFRGVKTVCTSAEFRALGKRILQTDPLGTLPRWLLERFPSLKERILRLVNAGGLPVARRPVNSAGGEGGTVEMSAASFLVNSEKVRRVLGAVPVVSRQRAMELTLEWVRHARLVSQ